MRTLRKLLRLPSRRTKKSGSRKPVVVPALPKQNKKAAIAKYAAIAGSEFDGGIVPYTPAVTKALTTRIKSSDKAIVPMGAKKPSFLTRLFAKKKPMTGGVGYTFNLDCNDGGLMRPEAYSECPSRGPADPRFFTELY